MYGNFCGPYWSDGKFQTSVANPEKQSIDDLDECCKQHDQGYATNKHLNYYDTKLLSCVKKVAFDDGLDYKKLYSYIVNKAIPIQQMVRGKQNKAFKKQTPNKVQERKLAKAEKKTQTMVKKLEKEEHSRAPVNTQINSRRMRGKLTIGGPMNRPARRGNLRKSSLSVQTLNVAGADYFDVVTVATTNAVGDILKTMELHPSGIPNTRLGFFTNMYDQYRLRSISVEYYSSVGTSTPGQILGFFDPDADESDISGPQLVHKGFSGKGKAVNVWGNSDGNPIVWSWRPPQSGRDAIRYCSTIGEKRTWSYGKFLLVASSTFGTSQTIGTLRVRYQIQFITPLLENNATIYSASSYISASPSGSLPFGTGALIGNSHNNVNVSRVSGEYINIGQPGSYLIAMDFVGTGLTGIAASGTLMTVSNIDFVTSATKIMYTAILTILPANVTTNRFGVAISGTELTDCEFRVCQVPISNFVEPPLDMTSEIERKIREYFENKETDNNNNRVPPSKRSLPSSRDEQRRPF